MDLAVQNTVVMPEASAGSENAASPVVPPRKRSPKLLYLLGGLAVILVSIAFAIMSFGGGQTAGPDSETGGEGGTTAANPDYPKYVNQTYFYEIALPKNWPEIRHSPLLNHISLFNAEDTATLEITAKKTTAGLDEYLSTSDTESQGKIKSNKNTPVKVGQYDAIEREESWPAMGLQVIATYVKISDMLYTFTLIPSGNKNAITNETIIRDYHAGLASFRLTDTTQLGVDLKDYTSQKVAGLAFKSFSLKYPQSWVLTETKGENSLDVSIYRNNYELTISQKAVGGAVCLFSDSPDFEGSSGDLRNKQFTELTTVSSVILRRYFNVNAGDKSTMFFCEKQSDGPYFQTPLTIGGLVYYVPAKFDLDIIAEMDSIVKSIVPVADTPSPTPSPSVTP